MTSPHIEKRDAKIIRLFVSGEMTPKQIAVEMVMSHEAVRQVISRKRPVTNCHKKSRRKV